MAKTAQPSNISEALERFQRLLAAVREGSEEASRQLVEEYGQYILRAVRRRLSKKLRPKVDSVDFVQSVWASFFADPMAIGMFREPEAIIAYFAEIAAKKVAEEHRKCFYTPKRDVRREVPLAALAQDSRQSPCLAGSEPTPSETAVAEETWQRLGEDVPSNYLRVLELLRQGSTPREIEERIGVNKRTVQRIVAKLKDRHSL
jgi:RNA polymerase sigma-70 factor (ECF subfamily)